MKTLHEQLREYLAHVRLTEGEKRSMRLSINEHMRLHPFRVKASREGFGSWMYRLRFAAPALLVVILCTGTAYAAQGALPGNLLYPIKVDVTEPAEVALAPTPEAKATVEAQIAQTRVAEAETLAAQGNLTASTTEELQASFDTYAADAIAQAAEAATSTASTTAVTVIATSTPTTTTLSFATATSTSTTTPTLVSDLATSLDAQATILSRLGVQVRLHDMKRRLEEEASSTLQYSQDYWKYQQLLNASSSTSSITAISTSSTTPTSTTTPQTATTSVNASLNASSSSATPTLDL